MIGQTISHYKFWRSFAKTAWERCTVQRSPRLVARVVVDGKDVSVELVKAGLALQEILV